MQIFMGITHSYLLISHDMHAYQEYFCLLILKNIYGTYKFLRERAIVSNIHKNNRLKLQEKHLQIYLEKTQRFTSSILQIYTLPIQDKVINSPLSS